MAKIPELKKKINSFLTKEEGKISKEGLVKTGVLIAAFSFGAAMNANNTNAGVSCAKSCAQYGLSDPGDVYKSSIHYNGDHSNALQLTKAMSEANAAHSHCIQNCHASHGSHCSGGWCD